VRAHRRRQQQPDHAEPGDREQSARDQHDDGHIRRRRGSADARVVGDVQRCRARQRGERELS
jgi:hypothetical protein